jgi:hypothetical protein
LCYLLQPNSQTLMSIAFLALLKSKDKFRA